MRKQGKGSKKQEDGQYLKFLEAAHEHGCDESDMRYDAVLKEVAQQKPKPRKEKKPSKTN